MNYKKIIKSKKARLTILKYLSFVPDKAMLRLQYRIKMGRKLNLKNPQRFSEKLQWYKLSYRDPLMIQCVDKYDVRAYVESKGLGHLLNECYGVFDRVEDIDFDALPNQFVLKDTLGSGGTSVIIIKDKNTVDMDSVKVQLHEWVNENHRIRSGGREWPYYSGKKHRIFIEEYLAPNSNQNSLIDYKFMCFNGKVFILYVLADRDMGNSAAEGIFDTYFNKLPYYELAERRLEQAIEKPEGFEQMLKYAETLSEEFPHARIDLYNHNNIVRFGEITFYDSCGYLLYEPDEFDFIMGEAFVLPAKAE